MRIVKAVIVVFGLTSLWGCVDSQETHFSPAEGDSRHYSIRQSIEIAPEDGPSELFTSSTYSTFKVTAIKNQKVLLEVLPGRMDGTLAGRKFSTAKPERGTTGLLNIQPGKISMSIDQNSGALVDITSDTQSMKQQLTTILGNELEELFNQVSQPNFGVPVTAQSQWSVSTNLKGVPNVDVKVTRVTEKQIWVEYAGGSAGHRLAGVAQLERDSGWVKKQVLTMQVEQEFKNQRLAIRRTEIMSQVSDGAYAYVPHLSKGWADRWIDTQGRGTSEQIENIEDKAQIFTGKPGTLEKDGKELLLEIKHKGSKQEKPGKIAIREAKAFDLAGNPIVTPMHTSSSFSYDTADNQQKVTQSNLILTAGADLSETMQQIGKVEAKVAWFPDRSFEFSIQLDEAQPVHYEDNGVKITFRPQSEKNVYALAFEGQPGDGMMAFFPRGQKYQVQYRGNPMGPDWLTAEESYQRFEASSNPDAYTMLIKTKTLPAELNLRIQRHSQTPEETRTVTFYSDEALRTAPEIEPETEYLYETKVASLSSTNIKPEGINQGQVFFVLGAAQLESCSASLKPEAFEEGTALVFNRKTTTSSFTRPGRLILETEDGIRRYFYGLGEREVKLQCRKTVSWTPTDITLNDSSPWVVSLAMLPEAEKMKTVGELLARYRFIDNSGRALSLVRPTSNKAIRPDTPLEEVAFSNKTLRVAGVPVAIYSATSLEKPVEQRFVVNFPNLPKKEAE